MKVQFKKSFERIRVVIEEAESAADLGEMTHLKKMKTPGDYYRIRVGDYRLGISVAEGGITFIRVLHRKEIYRYFP